MKKYRVVIVGMGKRGKHHATAFRNNPNFELVGICDIDATRLAEARAQIGASPETSTDAKALTAALKPDVFCFCTMPNLREELIRIGVETGVRLIAFEKPVADSSAIGMRIRRLLSESGVRAVVSHQHRYGPHYRKVKEVVESGLLGRVHTIYASSPGWMLHMMSHLIDYMRWYNGNAEAEWVIGQASGRSKLTDNHPSPDYIAGFIQFANGVRGVVETGAGAPDIPGVAKWWGRNRIRVEGDEGFAEVVTNGGWRAVTRQGAVGGDGAMNYDVDTPLYVQDIADWLNDERRVHPCHFESAYKGFEIMMGLCRSAVDGGQVALPLKDGRDELAELRAKLPDRTVIPACADHAVEFHLPVKRETAGRA